MKCEVEFALEDEEPDDLWAIGQARVRWASWRAEVDVQRCGVLGARSGLREEVTLESTMEDA